MIAVCKAPPLWAICKYPALCAIHNPLMTTVVVLVVGVWVALALRSIHRRNARRLEFVRRVSHEIKTPLTSLRLYADLLARGKLKTEEDIKDAQRTIQKDAETLSKLVDGLIEFGRIESDGGKAEPRG